MGIATPMTNPGTPDQNVFYLASTAGTYANFNSFVLADGEIAILKYNGTWTKEVTGAATAAQVTRLVGVVDSSIFQIGSAGWATKPYRIKSGSNYEVRYINIPCTQIRIFENNTVVETVNIVVNSTNKTAIFTAKHNGDSVGLYFAGAGSVSLNSQQALYDELLVAMKQSSDKSVISEDVDILPIPSIKYGAYYESDGTLVQYANYRYAEIDLSVYDGKTVYLRGGWGTSYKGHCFIQRGDSVTDISLESGYSSSADNVSFVANGGILLYSADYRNADRGVWVKNAAAEINEYLRDYVRPVAAGFISENGNNNIFVPIANVCKSVGERGYLVLENTSDKTLQYYINIRYSGGVESPYINGLNNPILPYQSIIIPIDRFREDMSEIRIYKQSFNTATFQVRTYFDNPGKSIPFNFVCPVIGCGSYVVSDAIETFAHSPRIVSIPYFNVVVYHTSMLRATEGGTEQDGGNYRLQLKLVNKQDGSRCGITLMDDVHKLDYIDDLPVRHSYNPSTAYIFNRSVSPWINKIVIRFSAIINDSYTGMLCKEYIVSTGEVSSLEWQKLSYNGATVNWTWANYIKMVNSMYGYSFDESLTKRYTLEHSGICEYNGRFYCVVAHQCTNESGDSTTNVPYLLMVSDDCIVWSPVSVIIDNMTSSEVELAINNGIVLVVFRNQGNGTLWMTCDVSGNNTTSPVIVSSISSKPAAFVYKENLYALANTDSGDSSYGRRNQVSLFKFVNGTLEKVEDFYSPKGYQYYDVSVYGNQIFMANTEDNRGLNYPDYGPTNDVSLQTIVIKTP